MPRGLFVTGTDTGVGKTVVSAVLLCRYGARMPLRYWKPIQTGIEADDDTGEARRLSAAAPIAVWDYGVRLARPVSPHLAARWAGTVIDIAALVAAFRREPDQSGWIVEGAGGALVPIDDRATMVDLMHALALPAVVVARTTLGTINHTLLTLEALRRRAVDVAGVVLVGRPDADVRQAIEHYGAVTVLGEMPRLDAVTPDALAAWAPALDPESRLEAYLS